MSETVFAQRIQHVPRSFIREILKVAEDPAVISFAGGLPAPSLFPVDRLRDAAEKLLTRRGPGSLQYGSSEGFLPLREWICGRYKKRFGLELTPDRVLVTTGSQQGLDLAGKILVDPGDTVVMERPGYLGAIQAFSFYTRNIRQVDLVGDGPDLAALERAFESESSRLFYSIPNFQNPSGMTCSLEKRQAVAGLCETHGIVLMEDDPYGELRFEGSHLPPVGSFGEGRGIMLGTLSKVVAPGLRIGWMVAAEEIMELFHLAIKKRWPLCPANRSTRAGGTNTMRLNFSNADEKTIEEGMKRLAGCLNEYLAGC